MSHEPGRERHMVYRCEHCRSPGQLNYRPHIDEYWCDGCIESILTKDEHEDNDYDQ
jgi:ssDNA-binding Zn-finger/Zn-ribbon topoisomerase 1